jgi:hypothetical protein
MYRMLEMRRTLSAQCNTQGQLPVAQARIANPQKLHRLQPLRPHLPQRLLQSNRGIRKVPETPCLCRYVSGTFQFEVISDLFSG